MLVSRLPSIRIYQHIEVKEIDETQFDFPAAFDIHNHDWKQVRDLVAENGDLKVEFRRAKAEVMVLTAERRGLEERFLLRTPSPPPEPPGGGISVAVSGRARGANVQQVGSGKSGDDLASAGVIPSSDAGPRDFKAVILDHASPSCDGDHPTRHVSAAGDTQASGAACGCSSREQPSPGDVEATLDRGDEDLSKAEGGAASGLELEAVEPENEVAQSLERESESDTTNSQSDDEFWASRGPDVVAGQVRSSERKAFDSCDSASSECDVQERALSEEAIGKLSGGNGRGDEEALASSDAQAAGGAFDSAFQLDVVRPGRRRPVLSRSLRPQPIRTRTSSENVLGKTRTNESGTGTMAEVSLGPTNPLSTSLPGSFLVAGGGSADRSSSGETSVGDVENDTWPPGSFIIAKGKVEGTRDGQDEVQVSTETLPVEGTKNAAMRSLIKRERKGHDAHNLNSFLNDGSQTSSDSRSPGG